MTDNPLKHDDVIHMSVETPHSDKPIEAMGIVRWRHEHVPSTLTSVIPPGMGIEFIDISPENLEALQDLFAEHEAAKKDL